MPSPSAEDSKLLQWPNSQPSCGLYHWKSPEEPIDEQEILKLLELEADVNTEEKKGWVPKIERDNIRLEIWNPPPGDEPRSVFRFRSVVVVDGVDVDIAIPMLYDAPLRKQWDKISQPEVISHKEDEGLDEIIHWKLQSTTLMPLCEVLHRRRIQRPCGSASAAWLSRDVSNESSAGGWAGDICCVAGADAVLLRGTVFGQVVRTHKVEDEDAGCSIFTYVQTQVSDTLELLASHLTSDLWSSWCKDFQEACLAAQQAPSTLDCPQTGGTEFYDLARGDEDWEREDAAGSNAVALDFLGVATCKNLVPALSAFRRLRRPTRRSIRSQEKVGVDFRPRVSITSTAESSSSAARGDGGTLVASESSTAGSKSEPKHMRRSSLRAKSREQQKESMEALSERLGKAVQHRSEYLARSELEAVPEEEETPVGLSKMNKAKLLEAPEETPRRRFTLPPPSRRRRPSDAASAVSTSSEESASSTAFSESSGSSKFNARSQSCSSLPSSSSTVALDALFERARAAARSNGSYAASTSASSRASSPTSSRGLPSEVDGTLMPNSKTDEPQPTMSSAAWVLAHLCEKPPDATLALKDGQAEPASSAQTEVVSHSAERSSVVAVQAFNFCFPQELCGVPMESRSPKVWTPVGWNRSSRRRRASAQRRSQEVSSVRSRSSGTPALADSLQQTR